MLAPGAPIPKTAAPSPGDFKATFEGSSRTARTPSCAPPSAEALGHVPERDARGPGAGGREIHMIDTRSTSMSTGIPAMIAAELVAPGVAAADIAAVRPGRLPDVNLFVAVDTLDYLRKGGRLPAAQAVIGTMCRSSRSSRWSTGSSPRGAPATRSKARARVIERVAAKPMERIAILHSPTSTPEEVATFRDPRRRQPAGVDPPRSRPG